MKTRTQIADIQPYVPGKLKEGAFKLASNENPLGPSPKALKSIRAFLKKINLYPDGSCVALREKLAARLGVQPGQLVMGNGSDEILLFIAGAYVADDDEVVTAAATFSEYTFASRLFGGRPVYVPMADAKFQIDRFPEYITPRTKAVFLCNPNNPTGAYITRPDLEKFLAAVSRDVLVVVDEAYYEYVRAADFPQTLTMLPDYPNLLVLRTFSKIYGLAGLRVGYAVGAPEIISNLNKAREPFNVNAVAQAAACGALDDDAFLKRSITVNEKGKKYLYQELDKLGLRYYPTQANFIFVYINQDCMQAFEKLMEIGVTIRPLRSFGFNNAIRVTIGTRKQNKFFIESLKKIL